MKVSFFNEEVCYGVDYSSRHDCTAAIDITDEQYSNILSGRAYFVGTEYVEKQEEQEETQPL